MGAGLWLLLQGAFLGVLTLIAMASNSPPRKTATPSPANLRFVEFWELFDNISKYHKL